MDIIIDEKYQGKTILEYAKGELGLSRNILIRLKQLPNGIMLNNKRVTVRAHLFKGDKLHLELSDNEEDINTNILPTKIPVDIVYEDDDIVVVNKPSGMPTHPSHNHYSDSLANALTYHYNEQKIPFVFRAVNRLDRETSGLVLVAKNRVAAYKLSLSMQKGQFKKIYYAILDGKMRDNRGEIKTYIRRAKESIIFREVSQEGRDSEFAHTLYEKIKENDQMTLISAIPLTGRTHQLRVHFAYSGAAILGDGLYGSKSDLLNRLALHAFILEFPHPSTGKTVSVKAPLPDEMTDIINKLNTIE